MICLNKALFLTHGNPVGISNLVSRIRSTSLSSTAVLSTFDNSYYYVGQVLHQPGNRSAYFSFVLPDFSGRAENLDVLIEFLCTKAGEMGALNVLAEIEESHSLFDILRSVGFSVFSWESFWKLPEDIPDNQPVAAWSAPSVTDENTARSLFQTLVPPLVQNAEPFSNGGTPRAVYKREGETLAYVEIHNGAEGIYLTPVIHPSVEDIPSLLHGLIRYFETPGRPVYLQVRSYQAWLSDALADIQAAPSPRFALLVKHLAIGNPLLLKQGQRVRSDSRQVEPTAPFVQTYQDNRAPAKGTK